MEMMTAVEGLRALAHEARLNIYRALVTAGPEGLRVGELVDRLQIAGPTLSFHLSHLHSAGLVEARRDGREIIQTVDFARMTALVDYLTENCCKGATVADVCKPIARRKRK